MGKLQGLLILLLCLLTSQAAQTDTNPPAWQLPAIDCTEDCNIRLKTDEAGSLYILKNDNGLSIIPYSTRTVIQYDLSEIYPLKGIRRDFIPFASGLILLFDYQSPTDELVLVDLRSMSVTPVHLNTKTRLDYCNLQVIFRSRWYAFSRMGKDGVLLCATDGEHRFIHLARLKEKSLIIEFTFQMGLFVHPSVTPWIDLGNSWNGKIYVTGCLSEFMKTVMQSSEDKCDAISGYPILYFDFSTQQWNYLFLDLYLESRWERQNYGKSPFVGVDERGSFYFYFAFADEKPHSILVKYDSSGKEVWRITEDDFNGERFHSPLLLPGGQLILAVGAAYRLQMVAV
jgi:hypothetical protein